MKTIRNLTAALTVLMSTGAYAGQVNILMNNFTPPGFFMYSVIPEWGDKVEEVTEGRVTVMTTANTLAPPPEQWNAIEQGIFDGAWIFNSFISNRVNLSLVGQLPFITGSDSHATGVALWNTYEKHFEEAGEYEGVHLLSLFAFAGGTLYSMTDTPINSMSDLKDRRMWAVPGAATDVARRAGSGIVSSPATQVHDYVSRNVVSGFFGINLSTANDFNVLGHARSVTEFQRQVFAPTFSLMISEKTWNQISPEDQEAIMSVSGATFAAHVGDIVNELEEVARTKAKQEGTIFLEGDPQFLEEMVESVADATTNWVAKANELGVDGQAALDYFTSEVQRLEQQGDRNP